MKLITYNIQFCRGRDGIFNVPRVAAQLNGADIIALQEVERNWSRSADVDQPAMLAEHMPGYYWAYGPSLDIAKTWGSGPNERRINSRRQFGNMIFSRWPILTVRRFLLPKRRAEGGRFAIQRGVVEATIAAPDGALRVMSTHLDHLGQASRLAQIDMILDLHAEAVDSGPIASGGEDDPLWQALWQEATGLPDVPASALLMGDLNAEPDSDEIAKVKAGGFVDCWDRGGNGPEGTFYRDFAAKTGPRIDYIFATSDLADRVRSVAVDPDAVASDHQPVSASLT